MGRSEGLYKTPFAIFDTLKRAKVNLTTRRPNILSWYSCGPTVYDGAHIGHASSFIRQDVIRRILQAFGNELTIIQVMGITDIDDKIIKKANETGTDWSVVSRHYEKEFMEDLSSLNVNPPHVFTRVTHHIPQIISFVSKLVNNGYAYPVQDGSVYFDTEKYGSRYGLFRPTVDDETLGQGQEENETQRLKKNVKDFALWKGAKTGEPFWNNPWGKGRPGWHIECSVMASQIFGTTLDLHSGGQDLKFPHHENEEAQCCAYFDTLQWTSHWLHTGHLHFQGDVKMSKSLGNTVSIRSFLEDNSPDVLRAMCIISKYRRDLEYSPDAVVTARKLLKKFHNFISDTTAILRGQKIVQPSKPEGDDDLWKKLDRARAQLHAALIDDFDTPEALKVVIEFVSDFNRCYMTRDNNINCYAISIVNFELVLASKLFVQEFLKLVGFNEASKVSKLSDQTGKVADGQLENYLIDALVNFRKDVRSFCLALDESNKVTKKQKIAERRDLLQTCDTVRRQLLAECNIEVKDHSTGSTWVHAEIVKKEN